ncbi:threonine aspartase 1-like isoform X2 [Pomacea canaliculata]|nr:threonine aspartase 1-like isoform X2 [Pomacea canaliculata]
MMAEKEGSCNRLFVAVHAGAGYHSAEKECEYKAACKKACLQAMSLLKKGYSAFAAAIKATVILEDAECTNAGRGSNLTLTGSIECDASVMDGSTCLFGAVGCVSGVLNPVQLAGKLIDMQKDNSLSHGRIPPSVLVGEGARIWAKQHGIKVDEDNQLITEKSKRQYKKYKRRIETATDSTPKKKAALDDIFLSAQNDGTSLESENLQKHISKKNNGAQHNTASPHDTVGAICLDSQGNLAAAVSSGGIWLKHPGRLGPAAMYGAGCWAQNPENGYPGVAVITSGSGEHLMKTLFAKTCADCIYTTDNATQGLNTSFTSHFLDSKLLKGLDSRLAGALALKVLESNEGRELELVWGHTTLSMALGYMWGEDLKPRVLISKLSEQAKEGKSFSLSGAFFSSEKSPCVQECCLHQSNLNEKVSQC